MDTIKKICRKCGMVYDGSAHSWYCQNCKQRILEKQREENILRIKERQIEGTCIICGKSFVGYHAKETCSPECDRKLKVLRQKGHEVKNETKKKIAEKNCLKWHLVSPDGKHYVFYNLKQWARDNCNLFGFESNEKNAIKIATGICQAKKGKTVITYKGWEAFDGNEEKIVAGVGQGKRRKKCNYKDWETLYDSEKNDPNNICQLYNDGYSINRIHTMTGLSASKIRKILIEENLWVDTLSVKISRLLAAGKTTDEISNLLNVSPKVINSRSPYSKGMYNWKPSKNALSVRKHRENKKNKKH